MLKMSQVKNIISSLLEENEPVIYIKNLHRKPDRSCSALESNGNIIKAGGVGVRLNDGAL